MHTFLEQPMKALPPTNIWTLDGKTFTAMRMAEDNWTLRTVHGTHSFDSKEAAESHIVELLFADLAPRVMAEFERMETSHEVPGS